LEFSILPANKGVSTLSAPNQNQKRTHFSNRFTASHSRFLEFGTWNLEFLWCLELGALGAFIGLSKSNNVVNSQQGHSFAAYKKKHPLHESKFFFLQNVHDLDELVSARRWLAPPLLKRRPNAGNGISRHRTRPLYEENRSDC